ncbi:DNA polymerase III subunit psi [Enterobacteriaceae bacterium H20N1]|uniref:DNA polymerase III subunit psi n=1 Tax=Dryocola boscaweniae TaxID=2925397 RepID=A0A9X2W6J1_9ENTR|nr:DNA polymerase III subunit psi [Dryocola boscaweniae]MCT4701891.1 DNA polymerase III subunit psi [Dryocola boscaweniae]MCT4714824.1 DNA polymerase III subunit psi [Dryocola boscaweniae]MCT4719059.1 DNA polymerase III subunit psi [Dryocola boscaweniae]
MSLRRDWLLGQLGITQWDLRRPLVLQGEIAVSLLANTRLVMVAEDLPALSDPLVSDVLRSLALTPQQVMQLTPDRAAMLPADTRCNSWRLGVDEPLSLPGAQLTTPALNELYHNGAARQALWQQICEHEHDLFPEAE